MSFFGFDTSKPADKKDGNVEEYGDEFNDETFGVSVDEISTF